MGEELTTTQIGGAAVVIGGLITAMAAAWVSLRRQQRSEANEDHQQKVQGYEKALETEAKVNAQKERVIKQLSAKVDELEEERILCRTEKATLAQENKWLRDELANKT